MKILDNIEIENCLICNKKLIQLLFTKERFYCNHNNLSLEDTHYYDVCLNKQEKIKRLSFAPNQWYYQNAGASYKRIRYIVDFEKKNSTIVLYGNGNGFQYHIQKIIIPKLLVLDFPDLKNFLNKINAYLPFI